MSLINDLNLDSTDPVQEVAEADLDLDGDGTPDLTRRERAAIAAARVRQRVASSRANRSVNAAADRVFGSSRRAVNSREVSSSSAVRAQKTLMALGSVQPTEESQKDETDKEVRAVVYRKLKQEFNEYCINRRMLYLMMAMIMAIFIWHIAVDETMTTLWWVTLIGGIFTLLYLIYVFFRDRSAKAGLDEAIRSASQRPELQGKDFDIREI